jgi:hypothetical protein
MSDTCDAFCINKEVVDNVRSHMLYLQLVAETAEIFKYSGSDENATPLRSCSSQIGS